jgi:hypothetical protein
MKPLLLFSLCGLFYVAATPQKKFQKNNYKPTFSTHALYSDKKAPGTGTSSYGSAKITGTSAISNCASVSVGEEYYLICYEKSLTVVCDEKSPSGNWSKTIYLDHDGDGHHDKTYYLFAGYKYSVWLNSNGRWQISQAA